MTLVIARKLRNKISFASDSRITFGTQGQIDFGIKIFSIPVKIYSPTSSETDITTLDYDNKLGLAVIGSAMNAYTIKESVYEILQHLQYLPGYTDLSMDGISNLIFKVFKKTTNDLGAILRKQGICQLVLGGYCPNQNKVRVFKYSVDITPTEITPTLEEILIDDGIEFFGSGKTLADTTYQNDNTLGPLHIIREVIESGQVPTVGGGLQYGEFVINNFKIYGVEDYKLNDDGSFKEYLYTLRGVNLYKDEFERGDDGFHVAYTFKRPFEQEINQAMKDYMIKLK
jgi:hypothetical protein